MSDYFDASGNRIADGLTARATDVNTLRDEVGTAFDLLPDVANLNTGTVNFAVDTGTANTYLVALPQTPLSYTDGLLVTMRPLNSNSGASTINVDGLGVKSIRGIDGLAISAGDIVAGIPVDLRYSTATGYFHLAPNSAADATAAAASAVAAAASAAAALISENAAAASALSAASVVSQDLSAIDRTVFSATIVDAFLYDTSKDSDGGAWRKRCAHTSWENETLSGNWLGSAANETAARAISGATTGSYYYDTTAAAFYTLNAGSGKTATYRGNVRQFPAQVLITVEANRVVIWDITQAGCPMWMVFGVLGGSSYLYGGTMVCVAMLNGVFSVGFSLGIRTVTFPADIGELRDGNNYYTNVGSIASRNSTGLGYSRITTTGKLVNTAVNDVAMTALPNAPVDVATGLPIPVIDVFTDAGTSRINSDGTVADLVDTAGDDHKTGCILASGDSVALNSTNGNVDIYKLSNTLADTTTPDRTYDQATVPALLEAVDAGDKIVAMKHRFAVGQDNGVNVLIENPASVAAGMIAYITKDYNSGWLPGAIKGAWLADTVAETITGTELVTNGTFTTNTTGWTAGSGATLAAISGELELTATATSAATGYQTLTTVVGKTYVASGTFRAPAANTGSNMARARVYDGPSLNTLLGAAYVSAEDATQPFAITFTATATNTVLNLDVASSVAWGSVGDKAYFDNISCKLADVDRSVKAKGLQVNGSLTKAAVASGAQLMGYSGFSAANYLEQPYNSDLDFGTGDFCIMGWIKEAPNSAIEIIAVRGYYSGAWSGSAIQLYVAVAGNLRADITDDGYATQDRITSDVAIDDTTFKFCALIRRGSYFEMWINGAKATTDVAVSNAAGSLSNASATLKMGRDQVSGTPAPLTNGTLALWRASATAPTAEQIKHIYETERPLFEANANCCLAGTSNAVTALAYDEETDLLHVGTSYGRSAFKGLVRVSSEATPVGAITALAAGAGVIVQGGATAVDVYVPAYTLREELLRDAEQMAKFGQNLVAHDFTATASQEVFTLPVGWEIVAVYQQGTLKRETTAWVRTFDGFKWSVDLVTGATVSDWISILAKRV